MEHEVTISESDLRTRFSGEVDVITHQPYRAGDRIVRCSNCHTIIKTEYIDGGSCPLCNSPFRTTAFETATQNNITIQSTRPILTTAQSYMSPSRRHHRYNRSKDTLFYLLALAVCVSMVPFWFDASCNFIEKCTFDIDLVYVYIGMTSINIISSMVIWFSQKAEEIWKHGKWGPLILLIPILSPYGIIATVWAVLLGVGIAIVGLCFALVIGFFSIFNA